MASAIPAREWVLLLDRACRRPMAFGPVASGEHEVAAGDAVDFDVDALAASATNPLCALDGSAAGTCCLLPLYRRAEIAGRHAKSTAEAARKVGQVGKARRVGDFRNRDAAIALTELTLRKKQALLEHIA